MKQRTLFVLGIVVCLSLMANCSGSAGAADARFEVSYAAGLDSGPITGRLFVVISKNNSVEPRLQAGSYGGSVPFFGLDVNALKPGENMVIDTSIPGYQVETLNQLPAGEYYVQAVLNVYTQVHRKDVAT